MTTKATIFCILAASLGGCAQHDQPTQSAVVGGSFKFEPGKAPPTDPIFAYLELPAVPSGCVARVYHISPHSFPDAPRTKTDWAEFLRAQGMIFPHGGFAVYLPGSTMLIVANTPEQLRLLDPL